jgi:hypothetical protein
MSEQIVNNWKPRKENVMTFATGNACVVQKPGPELALKTSHLHRRLRALRAVSADAEGQSLEEMSEEAQEEAAVDALEKMTDEQKETSYEIMKVTVAACVKRPRIYADPKPGQVGVNDIDEAEFLQVWKWYKDGCPDLPSGEGEGVSAADADRFPFEQAGGDGVSDSGGDVRAEAVGVDKV